MLRVLDILDQMILVDQVCRQLLEQLKKVAEVSVVKKTLKKLGV